MTKRLVANQFGTSKTVDAVLKKLIKLKGANWKPIQPFIEKLNQGKELTKSEQQALRRKLTDQDPKRVTARASANVARGREQERINNIRQQVAARYPSLVDKSLKFKVSTLPEMEQWWEGVKSQGATERKVTRPESRIKADALRKLRLQVNTPPRFKTNPGYVAENFGIDQYHNLMKKYFPGRYELHHDIDVSRGGGDWPANRQVITKAEHAAITKARLRGEGIPTKQDLRRSLGIARDDFKTSLMNLLKKRWVGRGGGSGGGGGMGFEGLIPGDPEKTQQYNITNWKKILS